MELNFSKLFHQSSKDHAKGHVPIPLNSEEWPQEWKTTYYKSYPRLSKVDLPNKLMSADLFDAIKKRTSSHDFSRRNITTKELSFLLGYSCGNTGKLDDGRYRRAQPSGGARFPVEVYPIVFHSGDSSAGELGAGLYHYNVKDHQLDIIWDREFSDDNIDELFTYPWVKNAAVGLVMTAVFSRNQSKYGERGYRYILIEAGHIGQNLYLVSEALGLKCCALGGTQDQNLEKLIDVDGVTESVIYGFAIGR